jgi:protein involved in polysaccharide export with SLBB domain
MCIAVVWCLAVLPVLTVVAQDQAPTPNPTVIVVQGAVSRLVPATKHTTVLTAIAQSGGIAVMPIARTGYVYRIDNQGALQTISIPLKDILHRKHQDIALQPGDILNVPDSRPRPI